MKHLRLQHFAMLYIACIVLLPENSASGQVFDPFNPYNALAPSAETYQMIKYGDVTPSLYTGAMNFSVPIYTYSDPDFTIPISLDYNFDGYKPALSSGTIGYGWNLNCGGIITRVVRGVPDEGLLYISGDASESILSYISLLGFGTIPNSYSNCVINNKQLPTTLGFGEEVSDVYEDVARNIDVFSDMPTFSSSSDLTRKYDTAPDIFHFNVMGLSGDFSFFPDGTIKCYNSNVPYGELTVDFLNPVVINDISVIGFRITDGIGTQYEFGCESSTLEFSVLYNSETTYQTKSLCSLKLHRIIAPNGREVEFVYCDSSQANISSSPEPYKILNSTYGSYTRGRNNGQQLCSTFTYPLQEIKIDGTSICIFDYVRKSLDENNIAYFGETELYQRMTSFFNLYDYPNINKRLEEIHIMNFDGETIKDVFLSQTYGSGTPKMLLSSVYMGPLGQYDFSYNSTSFPVYDTRDTDHWGYWNGRGHNFQPVIVSSLYDIPSGANWYKEADINYSKAGSLSTITYPTGGQSQITYEPNDYAERLQKNYSETGITSDLLQSNQIAGGLRVREICNITGGVSRRVQYIYRNELPGTTSSGILTSIPRYGFRVNLTYSGRNVSSYITETFWYGDIGSYLQKDSHIGYRHVWKKLEDNSSVHYAFNCNSWASGHGHYNGAWHDDYLSGYEYSQAIKHVCYPDDYIYGNSPDPEVPSEWISTYGVEYPFSFGMEHLFYPPEKDFSCMRGKLYLEEVFDSNNRRKKATGYNWNAEYVGETNTIWYNAITKFVGFPYKCYNPFNSSVTTTEYFDDGSSASTQTTYVHNSKGQVSEQTTIAGNDDLNVRYRYCWECQNASDASRLTGTIADAVKLKVHNGSYYMIANEHYGYMRNATYGNLNPNPVSVDSYKISTPVEVNQNTSFFEQGRSNGYKQTSFTYDSLLRPLRVNLPGGAYVEYTWADNGRHLVRKVENGPTMASTYTWQDMVGLSSITAPTGHKEFYEYDSGNRLYTIKNGLSQTVTLYEYHIDTE